MDIGKIYFLHAPNGTEFYGRIKSINLEAQRFNAELLLPVDNAATTFVGTSDVRCMDIGWFSATEIMEGYVLPQLKLAIPQ